jgi:hypothetical protein
MPAEGTSFLFTLRATSNRFHLTCGAKLIMSSFFEENGSHSVVLRDGDDLVLL